MTLVEARIKQLLAFAPFIPLAIFKIWASTQRPFADLLTVACIMAVVCAGIVVLCMLFSLYPSTLTRAIIPLCLIVFLGFPFNMRFPDYYLKRKGLPIHKEIREMSALNTHRQLHPAE